MLSLAAQRALAADQRSSELLVCGMQFLAILLFALVYALAPKAFPTSVPFEPVPWALAVYTLFTAIRLWLTLTDRLTPMFLATSVIVDIVLLMLTIWSFHLQYQQPATIYLKSPTLFYVFILISLRTLRLEPIYVILTGLSAMIGWLVLVGYVLVKEGTGTITRDFAAYMTSHAVLIGAEVDKVLSIGLVTAILSIVVVRARRLLVEGVREATVSKELARFFPSKVASQIRNARTALRPGHAVSRDAAIMMIDMRDFTNLTARMAPSDTVSLLQAYHRCVVPVIEQNNGVVDKYLGDGIIASFGAAEANDSYAWDALRATLALLESTSDWSSVDSNGQRVAPDIGIAVTAGPVLFGVTGTEDRPEFTVIGDAVNLAVKLEKHCKTLGARAIVTNAAFEEARQQGFLAPESYRACPDQRIDGVDAALDVIALP